MAFSQLEQIIQIHRHMRAVKVAAPDMYNAGAQRRAVVGGNGHRSPGGVLAIEDYQHEGISLYPDSPGFRAAIRATRALYKSRGGDAFVAGSLPGWMRAAGLELIDMTPNVICGGPQSQAFRWAGKFFPHYSLMLVEQGLLQADERERFLAEWGSAEKNPDAMFFSPMVVDIAARKPR